MADIKTIARARHLLEETLSERRCRHVTYVAEETEALCRAFALSEEASSDLCLAALLHDITKEKSTEAQLQLCHEYGIILSAEDLAVPKGLHAITGAEFAKREFHLPEECVAALRWHTTGRAGMGLCEKILFLADYIEASRTWAPCRALRRSFWKRMKAARTEEERLDALSVSVRIGLDSTLQDLIEEGRFIHPDTIAARNDLLKCEQV